MAWRREAVEGVLLPLFPFGCDRRWQKQIVITGNWSAEEKQQRAQDNWCGELKDSFLSSSEPVLCFSVSSKGNVKRRSWGLGSGDKVKESLLQIWAVHPSKLLSYTLFEIPFHWGVIWGDPGLSWWLSGKESTCKAGESGVMDSIPESRRSPGGGNGNPLQYSCQGKFHAQKSQEGYSPWSLKRVGCDWAIQHWGGPGTFINFITF